MFRAFPEKPYRQRAKIETIFSAIKRKLSSRAPGRSLSIQIRQALLLGLAYNLYRLRHPLIWRMSTEPVFILKEVKVVCFDTLLEVLILKVDTQKGGERSRGRK